MVARRRERALAAAVLATLCLVAPAAAAQPPEQARRRTRTLGVTRTPAAGELTFELLIDRHLSYCFGGAQRLPVAAGDQALTPAVYLSITPAAISLFDRELVKLARGQLAARQVQGCLPPGDRTAAPMPCVPRLRNAVAGALVEEAARLRRRGSKAPPAVLFFVDRQVPFRTFLAAAYAVALASRGAPPAMGLVVRGTKGIRQLPFWLLPPRPLAVGPGVTPQRLVVRLDRGRLLLETALAYTSGRALGLGDLGALDRTAGDLRSRDPGRRVAFVTADPATAVGEVAAAMAVLQVHFPHVVLGAAPPRLIRR